MTPYQQLESYLKTNKKNWLITGVAGFIGSHLLETLLKLEQNVTGIDNFSTGFKHNLSDVQSSLSQSQWDNFYFIEGNICNLDTCRAALKGVDYVLHQAALGSVPRSLKDPVSTNQNNVDGFLNMLTAAKEANIQNFVYASSSSVYGDHSDLPKIEHRIGNLLSPYAVTKYVNELYADVFARNYKTKVIGLRYFNVFGPRQNPAGPYAAVIPTWLNAMINNQSVFINGDGQTSRDFCYIQNAVQCNILAALTLNPDAFNQVYNVAVGNRTTLNQLYNLMHDNLKPHFNFIKDHSAIYRDFREGDINHSQADISKSSSLLGYRPSHTIDQGLRETIKYFLSRLSLEQSQSTNV